MTRLVAAGVALTALLALGAVPALAAFPGKPGPILYPKSNAVEVGNDGQVGGYRGLFVHGPRRSQQPRQLTDGGGENNPSYSADGRLIVFGVSEEKQPTRIYVMRNDGSGRRELLAARGGGTPAFFPDGRRIVFVRAVGGRSHLFTMRLDGTGPRQITRGRFNHYSPAVAPNGGRIAFVSDRDRDGKRDHADIFSVRPNGSGLRTMIDGPGTEYDPDYAPGGGRIAFVSNRGRGPNLANVFIARTNGRGVRRLTNCRSFAARCPSFVGPVFSPDGRHLVLLRAGRSTETIEVLRRRDGRSLGSFDSAGTDEEGFGSHLGLPTWGPRPR